MSDEMGGIRQKAGEIASESVEKSGEIVEGAKQALGGDVKEGVANILKAAEKIATGATEKGFAIAADALDKVKKPTESESESRARARASRLARRTQRISRRSVGHVFGTGFVEHPENGAWPAALSVVPAGFEPATFRV